MVYSEYFLLWQEQNKHQGNQQVGLLLSPQTSSRKGFWGTAGRMVQHPIPNLPPHPQRRGFFYGGMYINVGTVDMSIIICVHSTVYNVDPVEASKFSMYVLLFNAVQYRSCYKRCCARFVLETNPNPKRGGRFKWHPGTQVLRAIRHYQRTVKLCIPKIRFMGMYLNTFNCIHVSNNVDTVDTMSK